MAFLSKTSRARVGGPVNSGWATIDQFIQVTRAGQVVPQSTTEIIFRVLGGRVLVRALIGQVTVILTATDPVMKWSSKALTAASVAIGTAVDVASTVNIASLEAGGLVFIEGDGTAGVKSNAGAAFIGTNSGMWVAPQGEIYLTTGASNTTGQMQWDIWYMPLDPGATVVSVDTKTAVI